MIRSINKNPIRFNRICAIAALAFLVLSIGARYTVHGSSRQDFSQYYMGGVMARLGAWDSIYPIPKPDTMLNAGYIEGSTMKPRYALEATKRGVDDEPRFIQPPPVALLFVPLSLFTYSQAHAIWMIVLIGCTWAICLQAARMYELCRGELAGPSVVGGLLMLLIAMSPAAHRWIRVQNVSPIVGAMIGAAAIALVERRNVRGGLALWLGALMKYATFALLPAYVVMRRWKAMLLFLAAMIVSFAAVRAVAGRAPFDEYRSIVAPTLKRTSDLPQNQSIPGLIARMTKSNPIPREWDIPLNIARFVSLGALVVLIIAKPQAAGTRAHFAFAGCAACICWMLIFSPVFWEHYSAYLAPFFGWLAWEASRSRPRLMIVIAAAILASLPTPLFATRVPDPFKAHLLLAAIFILTLAVLRLRQPATNTDGK